MLTRRRFNAATVPALATALATIAPLSLKEAMASEDATAPRARAPGPVILDTDIGDDIDDTWALLLLLKAAELDLKLVVGDYGNPLYRARLLARLLDTLGHSDIPIGVGLTLDDGITDARGQQSSWLGDYELGSYRGTVHEDGVQAIIDTIVASPTPITLLCLGPVPNIAEALRRNPQIADNARFIGMHGSIYKGYAGASAPAAEYNVKVHPQSLRAVFAAPWDCAITPLDTCGEVVLRGASYRRLYESQAPNMRVLMDNYRAWLPGAPFIDPNHDMSVTSTTLFDAVAVHLALGGDLVNLKRLPLRVTDDGYTVIDDALGHPVNCAMSWKNREAFEASIVDQLLGPTPRPR